MKNQSSGYTDSIDYDDWFFDCDPFRSADECTGGI